MNTRMNVIIKDNKICIQFQVEGQKDLHEIYMDAQTASEVMIRIAALIAAIAGENEALRLIDEASAKELSGPIRIN